MYYYHYNYFFSRDIERGNEKVVVISVFGQSTIDSNGYKTSPLEIMVGKNILQRDLIHRVLFNDEELVRLIFGDVSNFLYFKL